jgi:hypothetical protein
MREESKDGKHRYPFYNEIVIVVKIYPKGLGTLCLMAIVLIWCVLSDFVRNLYFDKIGIYAYINISTYTHVCTLVYQ